jgi:hypothetical protein
MKTLGNSIWAFSDIVEGIQVKVTLFIQNKHKHKKTNSTLHLFIRFE